MTKLITLSITICSFVAVLLHSNGTTVITEASPLESRGLKRNENDYSFVQLMQNGK